MTSSQILARLPRVFVRMGIWISTAIVLLLCVVFARLFFAPINLDFARDTVVERAAGFLPGWQVSYGTSQIGWDWSAVRPWVLLEDIQLIDRRNRLNATISEARVVLSVGSLLSGASLSTIDIRDAQVNVTDIGGFSDDTDESAFADLFANGVPTPAVFKPMTEAFSRFATRLLDNAPELDAINFSNVSVNIARGEDLTVFSVAAPSFRLEHHQHELQLAAQLDASLVNIPTRIRLGGVANPAAGALGLTLGFSDVSMASVAPALKLPEVLGFLQFPFGLDLQLDMTSEQGLRSAAFEISIGAGELKHADLFPEGAGVDYGVISAAYNVGKDLLTFENVELSLGGNIVNGDGVAYWQDGHQNPGLRFDLSVDQATIADVKKYWPIKRDEEGTPRGAREWVVQNMIGGLAKNVQFAVNVEPDGSTPYAKGSFFKLLFDFENIDSDFLKTMSPLLGAHGNGMLTQTEFDMFFKGGAIEGLPIDGSKIHMHTIHKRGQGVGEIDVALKGNVGKILAVVTPPPVRIKDRIKIDLARLGGTAEVAAKITIPLVKAVPRDQVVYDIQANVMDGRLQGLLGGEGLTDAAVSLTLDKDTLTASGSGKINGVPMDIHWRENFKAGRDDPAADTSLMVMSGKVDQQGLKNLGVDVAGYLDGSILSEASFLGRNLKFRAGYFSADASDARLHVPQLAWEKDTGVPANINGTVFFDANRIRIEPLTVKGEGIDLEANLKWGAQNRGDFDAQFTVNQLGRNKLLATIVGKAEGGVNAIVAAERFDLAPLLARKEASAEKSKQDTDSAFRLVLEAKELLLLNGAILTDVKMDTVFSDGEPAELSLTGQSALGQTSLSIETSNDTLRPFLAQSADAGTLLRGLGLFAHMEGGSFNLEGETSGWGDDLQLSGILEVEDTKLVARSQLGPDVTEGAINGLDDYLEEGSLTLDVVDFPFSYHTGLLDISGAKANGPSLGITMEGQIDTGAGKINVNGVVVPAYGLNSLLGKIPLVGNLFSGGSGKGLFGVTYRVKGTTDEPEVNANPLSGLAPGFLRLLFEGKKGNVDDVELKPEPTEEIAPKESSLPDETEEEPQDDPPQPTDP